MLRWSTSCCPTGERRPLTLPFVSWLHKGRSVSSLLLLLFSSFFLSRFHCSHVGISGHLTCGRLQQPQEQRYPFLPVCAVSFRSPHLGKAAAATRAALPIPTNVCSVFQVTLPGEGCSSHKSSAAHSYHCVQCLGIQGIIWLPVFGVTDVHTDVEVGTGVVQTILRESALNTDWQKKNPLLHRAVEPVAVWHLRVRLKIVVLRCFVRWGNICISVVCWWCREKSFWLVGFVSFAACTLGVGGWLCRCLCFFLAHGTVPYVPVN